MLDSSVLVLNTTYEVVNICNVKRAIILIFKGVAVVEEEDKNRFVHSPSVRFPIPLVIRITSYLKMPYKQVVFSRKHILMRDNFSCQYCGETFPASELTLDHIIPKSRGGETRWENVVACCKTCNNKKGQRTLYEAKMNLVKKPGIPNYIFFIHLAKYIGQETDEWQKYIYS